MNTNPYLGSIASQPDSDTSRINAKENLDRDSEDLKAADAQQPVDDIDEALMESFPCSDPPCYSHCHA
jgi:hypothetical protein